MRTLFFPISVLTLTLLTACGDDDGTPGGTGGSSSSSTSSNGGGGSGGGGEAQPTIDCTGDTILHYEFHNQIVSSNLDIDKTGVLSHVEHDCCPPTDHPIDEPQLSADDLALLTARIEAAGQAPTHVEDGMPSAEGSLSGTLQVCTADKEGVILRDVARNDAGGPDIVTVNDATEAQQIRDFVESIVNVDMY
jgi:hypothetical protein